MPQAEEGTMKTRVIWEVMIAWKHPCKGVEYEVYYITSQWELVVLIDKCTDPFYLSMQIA
jgi:hypothetical protein